MDHKEKIRESENIHKYFDLAKEQEWRWNMRVMVNLEVVGELAKILIGFERRLEQL